VSPAADLLSDTAELVDINSVSHQEKALADHLDARLRAMPWLAVDRLEDNLVARTRLGRGHRLILAGHTDTVPANGNGCARVDGDTLWGLGSADMKSGLAVMLDLAGSIQEPAVDVTYVFYVCEEVARQHNGLSRLFALRPDLLAGDAAVLGEPTGGVIEAGCQGVIKLAVTVGGSRAHTARPWMGKNAIHRLGPVLAVVTAYEGRRPVIDGCEYREALQAVAVSGGVAGNVVPDRATLSLNHRFAPDRSVDEATAAMQALLAPALDGASGDRVEVIEQAPAAAPGLDHPLLTRLAAHTGVRPRAKLGWTDVAFFAERGIPAVNFGPGDPTLAHTADERVERGELDGVRAVMGRLVTGDPTGSKEVPRL
jgi:succinyl-diaminopimelate desuccinylase